MISPLAPQRLRRPVVAVAVAVSAALAVAGCSTSTSGGAEDGAGTVIAPRDVDVEALSEFYDQTLTWENCDADFECAEITVPLAYSDPDGDEVVLPVIRRPAQGGDAGGAETLVWWNGGPGASGIDAMGIVTTGLSARLRQTFDVVGIDARGTNRSQPAVDCVDDDELADYLDLDPTPDDEAEAQLVQQMQSDFVEFCRASSDPLYSALATRNVARDLDVLRSAMDVERLNVLAQSYGTTVAMEYLREFPDAVGRIVLDGVVDPALTRSELAMQRVRSMEAGLQAFAEACSVQGCFLGGSPEEIRAAVDDVLAAADEEPLTTDQEGRVVTESQVFDAIFLAMTVPAEEGFVPLEEAFVRAREGDGSALLWMSDIYRNRDADGAFLGNAGEVREAIECSDRGGAGSLDDVAAARDAYVGASETFGEFGAWSEVGCPPLPDSGGEAPGPIEVATPEPVLVVGTATDPLTSIESAQAVAEQLAEARLLVWETSSHTAYRLGSPCIDRAVDAYLVDGTLPEEGQRCGR